MGGASPVVVDASVVDPSLVLASFEVTSARTRKSPSSARPITSTSFAIRATTTRLIRKNKNAVIRMLKKKTLAAAWRGKVSSDPRSRRWLAAMYTPPIGSGDLL